MTGVNSDVVYYVGIDFGTLKIFILLEFPVLKLYLIDERCSDGLFRDCKLREHMGSKCRGCSG